MDDISSQNSGSNKQKSDFDSKLVGKDEDTEKTKTLKEKLKRFELLKKI